MRELRDTDRIESWKEIASYLRRDVRTVQRWEKEGLPVHRLSHDKLGSVYAFTSELDAWRDRGRTGLVAAAPSARARLIGVAAIGLVVAIGFAVLWTVRPSIRGGAITIGRAAQLTASEALELFPGLSPDGHWIAYSSGSRGRDDVMLQAVGAEHATNLTAGSPMEDTQPAFSPNGESIAFRSGRNGGGIFVMGVSGEHVQQVATRGYNAAWSPDGKSIAYATESFDYLPDSRLTQSELWVANVRSGGERRLYTGDAMQPAWSPSGRRIAVWGLRPTGEQRDIWTIEAATGSAVAFTDDAAMDWNPLWSADGAYLYFLSDRGGSAHWNLYRARIDDATGRRLDRIEAVTLPAAKVVNARLGPGGAIVWSALLDEENIQRVMFDASTRTVIGQPIAITSGTLRFAQADVSRDGNWIVMVEAGSEALYVSRADGSERRRITHDAGRHRMPRWAADGRRIAFYGDLGDGRMAIWTIAPDGSGLWPLAKLPADLSDPSWSHDGRQVAFADAVRPAGRWFLVHVSESAPQTPRALVGRNGFEPHAWSPDGRTIAGVQTESDGRITGLALYDVASDRYRTLATLAELGERKLRAFIAWLPDGGHLLGTAETSVLIVDTTTGAAKDVLNLAPDAIMFPSLPANAGYLYFTRRHLAADVWSGVLADGSR